MSIEMQLEKLERAQSDAQDKIARAVASGDWRDLPRYFDEASRALTEYLELEKKIRGLT